MNQVNHPDYGPLTVHERTPGGRSRRCTSADGTNYTLSVKVLNKLSGRAQTAGPIAPEDFVASVQLYLDGLSGPVQDRTARQVWEMCDRMLSAPKLELVSNE